MDQSAVGSAEDPLVAALPPATDYITYLTLLEYQLKPQNLSTLNGLLLDDNGGLAENIGWDLIRLVLPMLEEVPEDANSCLDIIARRGNPREVVVRIAEELEKLGRGVLDDQDEGQFESVDDHDEGEDHDSLPTFAGEAKRIHLGEMKLEGMPQNEKSEDSPEDKGKRSLADEASADATVQDLLLFSALLSMLHTVHPRIKTQYPSRFLATSLPASLGAYRRLSASHAATLSFLACLKKLSTKQRPPLPPRSSTASAAVETSTKATPAGSVTAPLPDPEAAAEASSGAIVVSDNEKAIIDRLLKAVLLELVDEYMSSFQTQQIPCMSWTSRLRETAEPKRVIPGKETEADLWHTDNSLKQRDDVVRSLVTMAGELGVDPLAELKMMIPADSSDSREEEAVDEEDEPSAYPATPSQIPFPPTGLLLLAAAQQFISNSSRQETGPDFVSGVFDLVTPLFWAPSLPTPAVQDALLSLSYQSLILSQEQMLWDQRALIDLISILTQAFTTNPHLQLRDDAHHIATRLLHDHADRETRVTVIRQTILGRAEHHRPNSSDGVIPLRVPSNEGTLKAVGVDWLKDEFTRFTPPPISQTDSQTGNSRPGLDPSILAEDTLLSDLVFARVLPTPATPAQTQAREGDILPLLSFYISVLNLCCVVPSSTVLSDNPTLSHAAVNLLSSMDEWLKHLLPRLSQDEEVEQSAPDIFALEDAFLRLKAIMAAKADENAGVSEGSAEQSK